MYNDILLNSLQTEVGPIVRPDRPASPPRSVHCYNCGYQGHYGHVSNVFELLFCHAISSRNGRSSEEGGGGWWSN